MLTLETSFLEIPINWINYSVAFTLSATARHAAKLFIFFIVLVNCWLTGETNFLTSSKSSCSMTKVRFTKMLEIKSPILLIPDLLASFCSTSLLKVTSLVLLLMKTLSPLCKRYFWTGASARLTIKPTRSLYWNDLQEVFKIKLQLSKMRSNLPHVMLP